MALPSLAEALSEDTHYKPVNTNPLTKSVIRSQDLDLKAAALQAAKDKAALKQQEAFENAIHATHAPNVDKRFAPAVQDYGKYAISRLYKSKDKQEAAYNNFQDEGVYDIYGKASDDQKNIVKNAESGATLFPANMLSAMKSDDPEEIAKVDSEHPLNRGLVNVEQ